MIPASLRAADIVLTASDTFVGKAIRKLTTGYQEKPSTANHVGLIVSGGDVMTAEIGEALTKVVIRPFGPAYANTGTRIKILRPLNLTIEERYRITAWVREQEGTGYGWVQIGLQAVDGLLSWFTRKQDVVFARRLLDQSPALICSGLVAKAFAQVGKTFGVPAGCANPDEIEDFADANPDKYQVLLDWTTLSAGE